MILLDKLSNRKVNQTQELPSITENMNQPKARTLTTAPLSSKIESLPQRGTVGSTPGLSHVKNRFIADLPANEQLQGIQQILSGQDTPSPIINNFVKGMAAQGKSPEEIRQAFIEHQKNSDSPLVLL